MPARTLGGGGVKATVANVWTAIQTFGSGLLKLRNPAGTFTYIFKGGAIVADRDVTMPLLTGDDIIVTEGMAQTLSNKTLVAPALGTPASGTLTNATGLPVAGIAASTVTALGVGSVELGHATDTTLTRVSAGVVAVEGVTLADLSSAQTLTNKTIGVASMGTGAATLTGIVIGAGTAALAGTALTASQSIRMNAGGTAYEGFTPAAGTVTGVTGTAPVASSGGAAPAISITGAAGQVLAGSGPAFTATPTLGASGTLGSLAMGNATSGTITLQPVTGALGTVTVSLPAATDTLVGKATTDTLTNKTLTSPVINTPTGIVKGDVGLGNVDNTSDATKDAATATLTNKTLTSPTLTTPALGTPASGVMTNVTGIPEGALSLTDITTANASATAHGFVPKWPNNTTTFFRGDGTYAAAGSGAVTREGGNTTEATTTSTTAADILTAATLTVAVGDPVNAIWSSRKDAGGAYWFQTRLKLNTTVVMSGRAAGDAATGAKSIDEGARFTYGTTNYLGAGTMWVMQQAGTTLLAAAFDDLMPTATLTDVVVGGRVGNVALTGGIDDLHVYSYAVS